jgi:hypothetical protein
MLPRMSQSAFAVLRKWPRSVAALRVDSETSNSTPAWSASCLKIAGTPPHGCGSHARVPAVSVKLGSGRSGRGRVMSSTIPVL